MWGVKEVFMTEERVVLSEIRDELMGLLATVSSALGINVCPLCQMNERQKELSLDHSHQPPDKHSIDH